jgi:hypothetical protein
MSFGNGCVALCFTKKGSSPGFKTFISTRCTELDRERNQSVKEKLGVQNIVLEIKQYQRDWLQHVERMDRDGIPKEALQYRPTGKRSIGCPRKRWKDQLHLEG